MGMAWSAAAALVCLLGGRQAAPTPRGARSRWVLPAASFLVLALFFAPDFHIAQFTLEGFALPYPVNSATPLLRLQSPERPSTSAIPLLPIAGLPAASAPIDVVVLPPPSPPPGQGGVIRTPGGLALRLPATSTALVGFAAADAGDYALANVYPLTGGERIVICPGSHGGCAERVLDVTRKGSSFVAGWSRAPSVHVGPCDVSSLTRWRFPKVDSPRPRAVALLDLYHYDTARCAPTAADANEGFWPRQDPAGGLLMPLRSFLIVSDGQPYLALLDGPESVRLEGAAAGRGGHLRAPGAGPHTLQVLEPRYEIASKPECKDDGRICKRILVYFRVHQVRLQLGSDRAYLVPVSPPVISVDPVCPDGRPCGTDGLVATWTKDASAASTTGGSALSFPFALVQGQPMQATFSLSQDALGCGDSPVPCVLTRTRDGIFSSARGAVTAVGPVGREQVLLRTTLLERPYWIMALVIGLLLWASSANPQPSRVAAVVVAVACVLLAARALFGFKILARFPHDPEGLGTALAGVATLPTALLFADARLTPAALRWPAIVLAANAAVLAVLTRGTATVTFGDQPARTLLMCAAAIAAAAACALWGRPMWNALLSQRGHRAVLAVLVGIGSIRLASALADRERIGLPLILLVWPAVVALLPAWLARSDRPLLSALVAALAIFFVQWPLHGDLGAALVSGPPLAAAAIWTWADAIPVTRRRLVMSAAAVAVLGAGMWWWHRSLDGVYPPVAVDERWVARPATNALCPDEDDLGSASAKLELTSYEPAFARSNVEQRRDDFLVRGAANRSGTRVGAEVHEFMSVLRRYAAGTPGAGLWGAGFMTAEVRRYGISEVEAQLSDGSPSTLVASEGGPAATLGLLVLHAAILAAMVRRHASLQPRRSPAGAALAFGALAAVSIPAWATLLMIGGNFGVLPFTGQSTPLLAPLSGTDLVLAPLLWGIALVLTRLASEEPAHAG